MEKHDVKSLAALRSLAVLAILFVAIFAIHPCAAYADAIGATEEQVLPASETGVLDVSNQATNLDNLDVYDASPASNADTSDIAGTDDPSAQSANERAAEALPEQQEYANEQDASTNPLSNEQSNADNQGTTESSEVPASSSVSTIASNEVGSAAGEGEDALYNPEVVIVKNDRTIPDPQNYVTYRMINGTYEVLLCGVNDANKESLARAILENLSKGVPIKFVNEDFVDADKYSTTCDQFDEYHCWLGSTSNILTFTGWASQYTNPLTGKNFANEDELFSFMSSSFSDANGLPNSAYSYFFDGLFGGTKNFWIRTSEATANKPFAGTSHTGFDPDVCSAALVERLELDSTLSALEALDGLADHALEMTIAGDTSHSVTVMGVVIDLTKTGAERYAAILIADTDNEPSTSDTPPSSFEEANSAKSKKTNSYTLYHLGITDNDGKTVALFKNYLKYKPMTYIGSFTQVAYCSKATRTSALETTSNATRNAKTTADIALSYLDVFDGNYQSKEAFGLADKITLQAVIMGMNADVEFNAKNTGHEFLENRIEVYRNGVHVGTIEKAAWVNLKNGINCSNGAYVPIDLSVYDFMKAPGAYTLAFFLNTNDITEAYVRNNKSPQSISFVIKDGEENEHDDGDDSAHANSTEGNASATQAAANGALPPTGDSYTASLAAFFALMLSFLVIVLLSSQRRRS